MFPKIIAVFSFTILLMLGVAISNSHPLLSIACCIALAAYLYLVYHLLNRGEGYRFFLFSALSVCVWTTLGFLQSASVMAELGISSFSTNFPFLAVDIDVRDYAFAFSYLYGFSLICCLISEYPPLRRAESLYIIRLSSAFRSLKAIHWLFSLLLLVIVLGLIAFSGLIALRGFNPEFTPEAGSLPWWYPFILFLIGLLPLVIVACFLRLRSLWSLQSLIPLLGILLGLYFAGISSRRSLVFFASSLLYYFFFFVRPVVFIRKANPIKLIAALVLAAVVIPFFLDLILYFQSIRGERGTTLDPVSFIVGFISFSQSDIPQSTAEGMTQNMAARPLILHPLAAAIKMYLDGTNLGFAYFQDILNSFLNSLPRPLYPDKSGLFFGEAITRVFFPFTDSDTAASPALFSFASFGFLGLAVYPIVMAVVYCIHVLTVLFLARGGGTVLMMIFSFSTLGRLAITSYAESELTGFYREFLIFPISIILIWKIIIYLFTLTSLPKHSSVPFHE